MVLSMPPNFTNIIIQTCQVCHDKQHCSLRYKLIWENLCSSMVKDKLHRKWQHYEQLHQFLLLIHPPEKFLTTLILHIHNEKMGGGEDNLFENSL